MNLHMEGGKVLKKIKWKEGFWAGGKTLPLRAPGLLVIGASFGGRDLVDHDRGAFLVAPFF
jgi:hypothetical protein